jgi:hypothetical protein
MKLCGQLDESVALSPVADLMILGGQAADTAPDTISTYRKSAITKNKIGLSYLTQPPKSTTNKLRNIK